MRALGLLTLAVFACLLLVAIPDTSTACPACAKADTVLVGNYDTASPVLASPITVPWERIYYAVSGPVSTEQKADIERSLRKWTGATVREVSNGEANLHIDVRRYRRQGVCRLNPCGPKASITVDPRPRDGFRTVFDHEARHLVQPDFHGRR